MEVTGRRQENLEEKTVMYCEPCNVENTKTSAQGACRECKEYMCTTCFKHHLKGKFCRNHVLLSLEEFSSLSLESGSKDVNKCEKHNNEVIKFYCRSHDVVGCGDCIVLEHTSCKPEYINHLAKTFIDGDMYKDIVKRMENIEEKKIDCGKDIKKNKDDLKRMKEDALKEIRQFRKEIDKRLDDAEAKILSQLQNLTKENTEMQTELEKSLRTLTTELEKMKQMLNSQLHPENTVFINAVACKSNILDMEKMCEKKDHDLALKTFEFVRNEQMMGILKSVEPLGNLKIEDKKKEKQIVKKKEKQFVVGARVRRGPDWEFGNQDGGGQGTLIGFDFYGQARVNWDNGYINYYRIGQENAYDIENI